MLWREQCANYLFNHLFIHDESEGTCYLLLKTINYTWNCMLSYIFLLGMYISIKDSDDSSRVKVTGTFFFSSNLSFFLCFFTIIMYSPNRVQFFAKDRHDYRLLRMSKLGSNRKFHVQNFSSRDADRNCRMWILSTRTDWNLQADNWIAAVRARTRIDVIVALLNWGCIKVPLGVDLATDDARPRILFYLNPF